MKNKKIKYLLAALLASVLWGFFSLSLRPLKNYPSEQILYYRIATSLVIVWFIILLFKRKLMVKDIRTIFKKQVERPKLIVLLICSGIFITLNWLTFIYVVNHINLKAAAFAYMVCPLITALGGYLLLKEALSGIKFIAIGIAFISIVSLATGSLTEVLWSVITAALYAFFLIIQRVITNIDKFNMLGIQLLLAFVFMLPFYIYGFQPVPKDFIFWLNITIIAVLFTIIPLFLSMYALQGLPSSTVGIIIYINPLVAFTIAFFYFDEIIKLNQFLSYLLLLSAVIIFNWGVIKSFYSTKIVKQKDVDIII